MPINAGDSGILGQFISEGDQPESEKKGILSFATGEDTGTVSTSSYKPVGGQSFQNPLYGITDGALKLQDPLYDTIKPREGKYEALSSGMTKKDAAASEYEEAKFVKKTMPEPFDPPKGTVENPYELDPSMDSALIPKDEP